MSRHINTTELIQSLKKEPMESLDIFKIMKNIALMIDNPEYVDEKNQIQELILRLLDRRDELGHFEEILDALARQIGLFPYLDTENLNLADSIAYEYHRPDGLDGIVFHRVQAEIYHELLKGKSVILSAPTSFGKSIIIDAIIVTKKYNNILILVPTIALIDETRKRLSKYKNMYKIITHSSQTLKEHNIFVLTQERVIEFLDISKIDFFVIDEFYKIQLSEEDDERCIVLNHALYKLIKSNVQFYMLGPNIKAIKNIPSEIGFIFLETNYKTVVTEYHRIHAEGSKLEKIIELASSLTEQTLIYCKSPSSVDSVALEMIGSDLFCKSNNLGDAVSWLKEYYHPIWLLPKALEKGIGIHHGKNPRAISQLCVRAFNSNYIKYLICTSTLIEGVNTSAKNVIIYDNEIGSKEIDYFTFNNIAGRSGRMFQHFIGNVYLFYDPPKEELPTVDCLLFSQNGEIPERLLIQMDEKDLNEISKKRIQKYKEQKVISMDLLISNSFTDPADQVELARELESNLDNYYPYLNWKTKPSYDQLELLSTLIWKYFVKNPSSGVKTSKQLTYKINDLMKYGDVKKLIDKNIAYEDDIIKINKEIENTLDFIRLWAMYKYPRLLLVIDSIQKEIFTRAGREPGNYCNFAASMENLFLDPTLIALDEYGIPIQISQKIIDKLEPNGSLDDVLQKLKDLEIEKLPLTAFEKNLIQESIKYL